MIKIEREKEYNDFEKEIIKIMVNYNQKSYIITFKQIYKEILKIFFDSSIIIVPEKNTFGIKVEYFNYLHKKNKIKDIEKGIYNTQLFLDFLRKIKLLANLLKELEIEEKIEFKGDFSFDNQYEKKDYTFCVLPIREEIQLLHGYLKKHIIISEDLRHLVAKNFMSDEEIRFSKNLKITQLALLISIITSLISLGVSIWIHFDNKKSNTKTELIITDEIKKSIIEILDTTNKEKIAKQDFNENAKDENKKIEAKK